MFVSSAAGILFITGLAKVVASFGAAKLLDEIDPIFNISFRHLMFGTGVLEMFISGTCLFSRNIHLKLAILVWVSTSFLIYRIGLKWMGWEHPCPCLGTFLGALDVPARDAARVANGLLVYLLAGTYCGAYWLWNSRRLTKCDR